MEKEGQFFKQVDTLLAEMALGRKSREVINITSLKCGTLKKRELNCRSLVHF